MWNEILKHPSFRQFQYSVLPRSQFVDLNGGTKATVPRGDVAGSTHDPPVYLVHAVGGDKKTRLNAVGHWYLAEKAQCVAGLSVGARLRSTSSRIDLVPMMKIVATCCNEIRRPATKIVGGCRCGTPPLETDSVKPWCSSYCKAKKSADVLRVERLTGTHKRL